MTTTVSGSYPAVNSDSDATINGLTVGRGAGAISTNTAVGASALNANTTGYENTAVGNSSLLTNTTGYSNTTAGISSLRLNTTGYENAAFGQGALRSNTTGATNVAVGFLSLYSNTTASNNTAVGYQAGYSNTTGDRNTAVGQSALYANTTGRFNSAFGREALLSATTANALTGIGYASLVANTTGANNTAVGFESLVSNTTASNNTAVGYQAGYSNTTGADLTAIGKEAGYSNTTGTSNLFLGRRAGYSNTTSGNNTYLGEAAGSTTTGSVNTFVGNAAGNLITTGSKNTILGTYNGNQGGLDIRTASNYVVLSDGDGNIRQFTNNNGFTKITNAGASASLSTSGSFHEVISDNIDNAVLISVSTNASYTGNGIQTDIARNTTNNSFYAFGYFNRGASAYKFRIADSGNATNTNGSYGTISDIKNKENIVDATPKLEKIKELQVRNFNFKGDDLKQIGFVAQEFEQVFPSMIEEHKDTDADGNDLGTTTKSIKTSVLVPILVKAVQELTAKVEALEAQLKGN